MLNGATADKLVLGIPTYGRAYKLTNPDLTDLGSPADGPAEPGKATREKGYLAYYEICEKIGVENWSVMKPDPEAVGPYATNGFEWVGYDDEEAAAQKVFHSISSIYCHFDLTMKMTTFLSIYSRSTCWTIIWAESCSGRSITTISAASAPAVSIR